MNNGLGWVINYLCLLVAKVNISADTFVLLPIENTIRARAPFITEESLFGEIPEEALNTKDNSYNCDFIANNFY